MRKVSTSRKSETDTQQWKTRPISICECLIVVFKTLYYSIYLW